MAKDEPLPAPGDNVKPLNYREQFQENTSKFIDPCAEASKASLACMNKYDFDRDKCLDYFQAYRDCKKSWMDQKKADRRAGRPTS
ncbi:cytochrome c oxidase-assembly factor cox23 [Moniliophthora roreri MCA 2997]|uniref:Cytochrome c oxidase-assembly factor COX23, mitochondrial n=1 Tax=Moniliophthora roreri (strain MCA 2997) TaxID=1381753 RepID=V2XPU8_MONRO|nr:cytochrome c oxidase-assembly factor cox23 [Moniliophthora roreri MCA 2997]